MPRGASHPEKFEVKAPMDTIDIYPFKLIRAPLFVIFFLVTLGYRVIPILLTIGKTGFGIVNLSLLVSRATKVEIRTYESHATLWSCTLPYVCMKRVMCVGWARVVHQNKMFCLLFF